MHEEAIFFKNFKECLLFFFMDARGLFAHSMKFACNQIKFLMYIILSKMS